MRNILLLACVLFCLSSYQVVEDRAKVPILSQAFSDRKVAKLKLDNGIKVYLISDPHIPHSAAALSIAAGAWHDPEKYQGMAHFLEHMLFMGSAAFPEVAEYSAFIRDHGGHDNAFTMADRTVYLFSVDHAGFSGALDRFSHFFIDPLFLTSTIEKELHAIDEECAMHLENESWRKMMVLKQIGNPLHPNAQFGIGNMQTLSGVPDETLKEWHRKHYHGNVMNLALISALPLDEIVHLADRYFSSIHSHEADLPSFAFELTSEDQKGKMHYIHSKKTENQLELLWEVPQKFNKHPEKRAAEMAAFVLDHPLKNSLHALLKDNGWIHSLDVDSNSLSKNHAFFTLTLDLTEEGMENVDEAIFYCFQAIAGLKQTGVPESFFKEKQLLSTVFYQYPSKEDPLDYAILHAVELVDEELETYPEHDLQYDYDPDFINEFIATLTPATCSYILHAPSDLFSIELDQKEKWSGVEYAVRSISPENLNKWREASPHPAIGLPAANPFIPHPLLAPKADKLVLKVLDEDDACTVIFGQDTHYLSPELCAFFTLYTPRLDGSVQTQALLSLFLKGLTNELETELYFARQSGISVKAGTDSEKMQLFVDGFSDQIAPFLKDFFSKLTTCQITESEFEKLREQVISSIENAHENLQQANDLLRKILFPHFHTDTEAIAAIEELTYEEFNDFTMSLFRQTYIEGLIFGNYTEEDAAALWASLKQFFPEGGFDSEKPTDPLLTLPTVPLMLIEDENEGNGNTALLALYQGPYSLERGCTQKILANALSEAFFDSLRNQQQTGYIVNASSQRFKRELFQFFFVHSTQYQAEDLLERFKVFITEFSQTIQTKIPQSRFDNIKNSFLSAAKTPDEDLISHAYSLYRFLFAENKNIKLEDVIQTFETLTYERFLELAPTLLSLDQPSIAILLDE